MWVLCTRNLFPFHPPPSGQRSRQGSCWCVDQAPMQKEGHDQDALGLRQRVATQAGSANPPRSHRRSQQEPPQKNPHSEVKVERPKAKSRSKAPGAARSRINAKELRLRCHYQNPLTSRCRIRRPVSPDTHAMYGLGLKMRRQQRYEME